MTEPLAPPELVPTLDISKCLELSRLFACSMQTLREIIGNHAGRHPASVAVIKAGVVAGGGDQDMRDACQMLQGEDGFDRDRVVLVEKGVLGSTSPRNKAWHTGPHHRVEPDVRLYAVPNF